ncbi:MAG: hypothetical protein ACRCUA_00620 [Fusobacteriaceae bacterium]
MKKIGVVFFIIISLLSYAVEHTSDTNEFKLGDKVQFEIQGVTEDKLDKVFKEIESKKISKIKNGLKIDFRNWKLGEEKYSFGKYFLKLNIMSNLKSDEKDIFLNYVDGTATKKKLPKIPYLFSIGIGMLIYSVILLIKKDKKEIYLSPEEKFQKRMDGVEIENFNYEISYALREYIDSVYKCNFLNGNYEKIEKLSKEDIDFVKKLDYIKFSGKSDEELEIIKSKAFKIYKKIKEVKKNA